ncbi:MAG: sugar transferase [Cyclobacteriaceae bacterium]|nr:sugar transferase [Cyclobacteriaceae bacterium]
MSYKLTKSIAERFISLFLLFALSPLLLLILLILASGGPKNIFFIQNRTGKDQKIFRLIKFKTMRDNAAGLLQDKDRLTFFGRLLRSSSLDELPQLWNVLTGQMSLIGPRPLLPEYLPWYYACERLRFTVRPGITGLAQIKGRNSIPWKHRLRYDTFYAQKICFSLDLFIFLHTLLLLFSRNTIEKHDKIFSHRLDVERSTLHQTSEKSLF